jgi:hypothetical protein
VIPVPNSPVMSVVQMQGLVTNDYRGGYQWPGTAEDEEDGYPLSVPLFSPVLDLD